MKYNGKTPKYVRYVVNILQEIYYNINKTSFKSRRKYRLVYDKLSLNLEPKVNDFQLSYNLRCSVISTKIDRILNFSNL